MFYPKLAAGRQQTLTTEAFGGYDHNLELADGEFYDMENLSADEYPLLAPRPRRGTSQAIEGVQGILAKDALCWVQNQVLYINGASMEAYMPSVSISAGEKQLISMGAYLCIFPDGIYFNTEKYSDNGYMGQENTVNAASTNIDISLCLVDGTALTVSYKQASQPAGKPDEWPVLAGYVRQAPHAQAVGGGNEPVGICADGVSEAFCQWHRSRFQAV